MSPEDLTPDMILHAYTEGIFPMARPEEGDEIYWYSPDPRAILPLESFRVSSNLRKTVRRRVFDVTFDQDFEAVIAQCARPRHPGDETWISPDIAHNYVILHQNGYAHSVECRLDGELAGGLYGVSIGGAFFGESMFFRVRDASKVALVHLVKRLVTRGFGLLDVQFSTPHLRQFGVVEIPRTAYQHRLRKSLALPAQW